MSFRHGIALAAAATSFWPLLTAAESPPNADCRSVKQAHFASIKAGDRVAEFPPDDGCVTLLLARKVGDDGRVYRVSTTADDAAAVSGNVFAIQLKMQLHAAPDLWSSSEDPGGVYGYWTSSPPAENFATPEPLDLIWAMALDEASLGAVNLSVVSGALLKALKPGGVLVISDAASRPLRRELMAAGFELVKARRSSLLKFRRP
ncbi:hypothetical protein [Nevskia sp.]|uniref:hypothetical protein n=1 Tax=Nevskia sp. TaxID=1929292 RepID=UPI0025DAA2A7|nr:hypothetical protein [Nevskia sp.]